MVKQSRTRRIHQAAPAAEINRRDLWLAGLGAVSLTRKRGIELVGSLRDESRALRERAGHVAANLSSQFTDLSSQFNGGVDAARNRFTAVVTPLRARAEATLQRLGERAPARLREVLARFGLTIAARRAPTRRGVVRNAASRRAAKAPSRRRAA